MIITWTRAHYDWSKIFCGSENQRRAERRTSAHIFSLCTIDTRQWDQPTGTAALERSLHRSDCTNQLVGPLRPTSYRRLGTVLSLRCVLEHPRAPSCTCCVIHGSEFKDFGKQIQDGAVAGERRHSGLSSLRQFLRRSIQHLEKAVSVSPPSQGKA